MRAINLARQVVKDAMIRDNRDQPLVQYPQRRPSCDFAIQLMSAGDPQRASAPFQVLSMIPRTSWHLQHWGLPQCRVTIWSNITDYSKMIFSLEVPVHKAAIFRHRNLLCSTPVLAQEGFITPGAIGSKCRRRLPNNRRHFISISKDKIVKGLEQQILLAVDHGH